MRTRSLVFSIFLETFQRHNILPQYNPLTSHTTLFAVSSSRRAIHSFRGDPIIETSLGHTDHTLEEVFGHTVFGRQVFGRQVFGRKVFGRTFFGRAVFGRTVFGRGVSGERVVTRRMQVKGPGIVE